MGGAEVIGATVEIRPAFNSETGERDIWDEIAGCAATVLRVHSDDTADVQLRNGDETNVHLHRLKHKELT
jgi:hypothetical protein